MIAKFLQAGDLAADGYCLLRDKTGDSCSHLPSPISQTEQLREQRELGLDVALSFLCCHLNISLVPEVSHQF